MSPAQNLLQVQPYFQIAAKVIIFIITKSFFYLFSFGYNLIPLLSVTTQATPSFSMRKFCDTVFLNTKSGIGYFPV